MPINIQQLINRIDAEEAETRVPQHSARMLLKAISELQERIENLEAKLHINAKGQRLI